MIDYFKSISELEIDKNIAIFFPSYKKLDWFFENITIKKTVHREYVGMPQEELMTLLRSFAEDDDEGVIAGVMGGRIAEGLDFPKSLGIVVIAGMPYPVPGVRQEALQHYYDKKFNSMGWEFTVHVPTIRKILQAAGRAIRSETDKGFIIIADSKAQDFKDYIPELEQSDDIVSEINEFFEA